MGRVLFATMIAAAPVLTVPLSQAASGAMHFAAPGPPANPQRTHVSLAGLSGPDEAGDTTTDAPQLLLQTGPLPEASMSLQLDGSTTRPAKLAISDQADDVRRCYQTALTRIPDLRGELTVSLDIAQDGHTRGEVLIDQTGDWRLVSCIHDVTALWLVPSPTDRQLRLTVSLQPA